MTDQTHVNELRDRPIGELLRQLADETATLVRKELELAKAEMSEKGKKAGLGAGMFGGAGIAALLALGTLTAFLVLALDEAMPAWLAALLVALVWAAIAGALALVGRQRLQEATPAKPDQTVESVKDDIAEAKSAVKSGRP